MDVLLLVAKTYHEIHRHCEFFDFEIQFWASMRYKERENSQILVDSRFEADEFEVQVLWRIYFIIVGENL